MRVQKDRETTRDPGREGDQHVRHPFGQHPRGERNTGSLTCQGHRNKGANNRNTGTLPRIKVFLSLRPDRTQPSLDHKAVKQA